MNPHPRHYVNSPLGDRIRALMADRPRTVMFLALELREPEYVVIQELLKLRSQRLVTVDPVSPIGPRAQLWRLRDAST